jgi:hypothetical protein
LGHRMPRDDLIVMPATNELVAIMVLGQRPG